MSAAQVPAVTTVVETEAPPPAVAQTQLTLRDLVETEVPPPMVLDPVPTVAVLSSMPVPEPGELTIGKQLWVFVDKGVVAQAAVFTAQPERLAYHNQRVGQGNIVCFMGDKVDNALAQEVPLWYKDRVNPDASMLAHVEKGAMIKVPIANVRFVEASEPVVQEPVDKPADKPVEVEKVVEQVVEQIVEKVVEDVVDEEVERVEKEVEKVVDQLDDLDSE